MAQRTDELQLKLRIIAKQLTVLADSLDEIDSEVSCCKCADCGESMMVIELYRDVGYLETIYECEKCMNN